MAYKTYSEKLKSPNWQKKRLEILERDNFTCLLCGDTETTLHVHHKLYKKGKEPWEYEDDNFETLCEVCHTVVEHYKGHQPPIKPYRILKRQIEDVPISQLAVFISVFTGTITDDQMVELLTYYVEERRLLESGFVFEESTLIKFLKLL